MRRTGMRGFALLDLLASLAVLAVLLAAAVPAMRTIYARVAVEYEAMHLIAELRRIQAIDRMTEMNLYMIEGKLAWEREPRLKIYTDCYVLHHPFEGAVHRHEPLPLVRFVQETGKSKPVVFDSNGGIANEWSSNMKIRVYAVGYEKDAIRVVIDKAARIRLQREARREDDEE